MLKKKKLYKIEYGLSVVKYTTIIVAKDEFQAINKFHKMITKKDNQNRLTIFSIEEYKLGQ